MGLEDNLGRLADQVSRLTMDMAGLWPNVVGFLAEGEAPYHAYLGATGPAVRAVFFESALDADRSRIDELDESKLNIETSIALMPETLHQQQVTQQKQVEYMHSLKSELDASANRASMQPDRKGDNDMITHLNGV